MTAKGNSSLGFIRRNVLTTSQIVRNTKYKQHVSPVLEYASASWYAVSATAAGRLEAVQRRAARLVCGIRRTDRNKKHHQSPAKTEPSTSQWSPQW